MKEFFVGLLVILMMAVLSGLGFLLLPLFLVLGFILKLIIGFFLFLFVIWLVGKATLLLMDAVSGKRKEENR
jgi:hypothetical protein